MSGLLRLEAGAIPYEKHHHRAQEVLCRIIEVLGEAGCRVDDESGVQSVSSIDLVRTSRIFFISGEPGSGKSSLYLTLKAMLNKKPTADFTVSDQRVSGTIGELQKSVRFLEPLDLEVGGEGGENLLAAVVVRIFEALDGGDSPPTTSKDCQDALKELEELAGDIGIAWDGNLQARAGALDPDTFSTEVLRTQRARLRINDRLRKALNKLSTRQCCGCSENTLFVLPVDDFYLKPNASLQLLRLLRMISIPRLFFLVMGDIKTVEALFIEKSLGDWTEVAGKDLFTHHPERLDQAITRARELRARYLRKLLPPGQRAVIEIMDWDEALKFEADPRGHGKGSKNENLMDLMGRVAIDPAVSTRSPFSRQKLPKTLLEFLLVTESEPLLMDEKQSNQVEVQKKHSEQQEKLKERQLLRNRGAYSAVQILDATPREMADWVARLSSVISERKLLSKKTDDEQDAPLLLMCVQEFVDLVREEHSFLNQSEQAILEGVLSTRQYSVQDISFDMERLIVSEDWGRWKMPPSGESGFRFRKHKPWNLSVNKKTEAISSAQGTISPTDGVGKALGVQIKSLQPREAIAAMNSSDPYGKLPPRPAAWFILLHDLAWSWNQDSVNGNLIQSLRNQVASPDEKKSSSAVPDESLPGWAIRWDGSTWKHLPLPAFDTFRAQDLFLRIWNNGVEWLGQQDKGKATAKEYDRIWELSRWVVENGCYSSFVTPREGSDMSRFSKPQAEKFKTERVAEMTQSETAKG